MNQVLLFYRGFGSVGLMAQSQTIIRKEYSGTVSRQIDQNHSSAYLVRRRPNLIRFDVFRYGFGTAGPAKTKPYQHISKQIKTYQTNVFRLFVRRRSNLIRFDMFGYGFDTAGPAKAKPHQNISKHIKTYQNVSNCIAGKRNRRQNFDTF